MAKSPLKSTGTAKGGDIDSSIQILSPTKETLKVVGKLSYNEGDQAWSTLRLKKEILQKFPHLKDKKGNFVYVMAYFDNYDKLKEEIKQFEKDENAVPLVFFIGKDTTKKDSGSE